MKIFYLIYIFLISFSCSNSYLTNIKATSQNWNIKNQNNITGTNYHILIKSKLNHKSLIINNLCVNNKLITKFNLSVIGKSNNFIYFEPNDTIIISVNVNNVDNFDFCNCKKNSIIIDYSVRKKQKHKVVNDITILPDI